MKLGIHAPKQGATDTFRATARALLAEVIVWTISEAPENMGDFPDALNILRVPTPLLWEHDQTWLARVRDTCEDWSLHCQPAQLIFQLGNEPEIQANPDVPEAWDIDEWKKAWPDYAAAFKEAFPDNGILCAPFSVGNSREIDSEYVSHGHGVAVHCYGWADKNEAAMPYAGASWSYAIGHDAPVYVTEVNSRPTDVNWLTGWFQAAAQHHEIEGAAFYIADCPPDDVDYPYNFTEQDARLLRTAYDEWASVQSPTPPIIKPLPPPQPFGVYTLATNPMATAAVYAKDVWRAHIALTNPQEAGAIVDAYEQACDVTGYDPNVATMQGVLETGNFGSPRWRLAHNAAGIGIYGDDTPNVDFRTVERGIKAQVELLNDYFGDGTEHWGILQEYGYGGLKLGFTHIGQLTGVWAADPRYGDSIVSGLNEIMQNQTEPPAPPTSVPPERPQGYSIVTPVDCPVLQGSDGPYSHGGNVPGFYAMDYGCEIGTPIRAAAAGTVGLIYWQDSNPISLRTGHSIWINHDNGYSTFSCHMTERHVEVGDEVKQGQIIGTTGDPASQPGNGYGSGPHLHWEIWDTAAHQRVKMEDLERAGIAGPWKDGGDDMRVDGHIDDGRLRRVYEAMGHGFNPNTGITQRWIAEYRAGTPLGAATSEEEQDPASGAKLVYFTNGFIASYPDGTTTVN